MVGSNKDWKVQRKCKWRTFFYFCK